MECGLKTINIPTIIRLELMNLELKMLKSSRDLLLCFMVPMQ